MSEPKFKIGDEAYLVTTDDYDCTIVKKIKIKGSIDKSKYPYMPSAYTYESDIHVKMMALESGIFKDREEAIAKGVDLIIEMYAKDKIEYLKRESDK